MVVGDKLQELKLKKVYESRGVFAKLFLEAAKQGDFKRMEDSALFQSTKVSFDNTRIQDETWLKNLETLWGIWSDEAGDLRLTNVISWTQINLCNAVLSKDEVYRLRVLMTRHLLMFNIFYADCFEDARVSEANRLRSAGSFLLCYRSCSEVFYS